jgi:hypothetical protein
MARTAHGKLTLLFEIFEGETSVGADDADAVVRHRIEKSIKFESGTDNGDIDRVWSESADATTTPTTLDVLGTLTSRLNQGNTVSTVELNVMVITNEADVGGGNLLVGGGSNPIAGIWMASGDGITIPPQGFAVWAAPQAGIAPVAGTGDILTIAASTGTVAYKIGLAGRSV